MQLSLLALSCGDNDMLFAPGFSLGGVSYVASGGGDVAAPSVVSIAANAAGNLVLINYSEALNTVIEPATTDYALTSDGASVALTSVNVAGSTVELVPTVAIMQGASLLLAYTAPGSNKVQDLAGNAAPSFSATAVTNSSTRTPANTLSGKTYRWLEAGLGETTTADSGGGASDAGGGGGAYVLDALADQGPGS